MLNKNPLVPLNLLLPHQRSLRNSDGKTKKLRMMLLKKMTPRQSQCKKPLMRMPCLLT